MLIFRGIFTTKICVIHLLMFQFLVIESHATDITKADVEKVRELNQYILSFYSKCKKFHYEMENPTKKHLPDDKKSFACKEKYRDSYVPFDLTKVPLNSYTKMMEFWQNCTNGYYYHQKNSKEFKELCLGPHDKIKKIADRLNRNLDVFSQLVSDEDPEKQKSKIKFIKDHYPKWSKKIYNKCIIDTKCEEEAFFFKTMIETYKGLLDTCKANNIDEERCKKLSKEGSCDSYSSENQIGYCLDRIRKATTNIKFEKITEKPEISALVQKSKEIVKKCQSYKPTTANLCTINPGAEKKLHSPHFKKLNDFINSCSQARDQSANSCNKLVPDIQLLQIDLNSRLEKIDEALKPKADNELLKAKTNRMLELCLRERMTKCEKYSGLLRQALEESKKYMEACATKNKKEFCINEINRHCQDTQKVFYTRPDAIINCRDKLKTEIKRYTNSGNKSKEKTSSGESQVQKPQSPPEQKSKATPVQKPTTQPTQETTTAPQQTDEGKVDHCKKKLHDAISQKIVKDDQKTFRKNVEDSFETVQEHALSKTGILLSVVAKAMREYINENKEVQNDPIMNFYKQIDIEKNILNNIQKYLDSTAKLNDLAHNLSGTTKKELNEAMKDFFSSQIKEGKIDKNKFVEPFIKIVSKMKYTYKLTDGTTNKAVTNNRNIQLNHIDREFLRTFLGDKDIKTQEQFFNLVKDAILNQQDPSKPLETDKTRDQNLQDFKARGTSLKNDFFTFLKEEHFKDCFNSNNLRSTLLYLGSQLKNEGATNIDAYLCDLSKTTDANLEQFSTDNLSVLLKNYLPKKCDNEYLDPNQNCKKCIKDVHDLSKQCKECTDDKKEFPSCTEKNDDECDDNGLTGCSSEEGDGEGIFDENDDDKCSTSDQLIETTTCLSDKQKRMNQMLATIAPAAIVKDYKQKFSGFEAQFSGGIQRTGGNVNMVGQVDLMSLV